MARANERVRRLGEVRCYEAGPRCPIRLAKRLDYATAVVVHEQHPLPSDHGLQRDFVLPQLVHKADGSGRVLAVELLLNNDAIANLIRKGKSYQIPTTIQTSRELGMQSLDMDLQRLYYAEVISAEEAFVKASNKDEFRAVIRNKPKKEVNDGPD